VVLRNIRGIRELKVAFPYPVTVLAGPNACGKTTVLFACACCYDNREGANPTARRYPSDLFPGLNSSVQNGHSDTFADTVLEFSYLEGASRRQMRWTRAKDRWNKSFGGRAGATQPTRPIYVRTLASFTNPSEVRSLLQLGRQVLESTPVTAQLLAFAHRLLPQRYRQLDVLAHQNRDILFAQREDGADYSEFQMSSGERAILRLSRDISSLENALILIDEVDVGLHPYTQQQLMLELQRLALRQNLQIIVTSHSPVILESVPVEGRVFLDREDGNVVVRENWRDVLQRALYGRPLSRLSILCEDKVAKSIVQGVMDSLGPRLGLSSGDLDIGHDTGKDEFAHHVRTLSKFKLLDGFLFVLDGDARNLESSVRQAAVEGGQALQLLFLPGEQPPEVWLWSCLREAAHHYADELGLEEKVLVQSLQSLERLFEASTSKPAETAKQRMQTLMDEIGRSLEDVARRVARREATVADGSLVEFSSQLEDAVGAWRARV
jgi:predicted ATPase